MPTIKLTTKIHAPIERVFDLSRSIDAHQVAAVGTSEVAIAGITSGLINLNEEVVWEARHFGIRQKLTVKITKFEFPHYFQDLMIKGAFSYMQHDHRFREEAGSTVMDNVFEYEAPFGLIGRTIEALFLTRYMTRFLNTRNVILKRIAESNEWKQYLDVKD